MCRPDPRCEACPIVDNCAYGQLKLHAVGHPPTAARAARTAR
jgi:adenine-specific DNA glycosylase